MEQVIQFCNGRVNENFLADNNIVFAKGYEIDTRHGIEENWLFIEKTKSGFKYYYYEESNFLLLLDEKTLQEVLGSDISLDFFNKFDLAEYDYSPKLFTNSTLIFADRGGTYEFVNTYVSPVNVYEGKVKEDPNRGQIYLEFDKIGVPKMTFRHLESLFYALFFEIEPQHKTYFTSKGIKFKFIEDDRRQNFGATKLNTFKRQLNILSDAGYVKYEVEAKNEFTIRLSRKGVQIYEEYEPKYFSLLFYQHDNPVFEERELATDLINSDEKEQIEVIETYKKVKTRDEIISELKQLKETTSEKITINSKVYKRDNETIAKIKILRNFKCQICDTFILKKDGSRYIEAAHIKRKSDRGQETPENILLLCPNHHKEFDYGELQIVEHTKNSILFLLNGQSYTIDLTIK